MMNDNQITAVTELDQEKYLTKVYAGGHFIYADEPEELGGTDEGMTPGALLLASLGSCTAITLKMYANRKKIPLDSVRIHLTICKEEEMSASTKISRKIELKGELTAEQRSRMIEIADKCPIHKILHNPITIDTVEG
ncbi:OsmC family protein [Pedobacter sp. MC2016-15]|jgi:putative redox protein|uniref:OsmC family protein n=1 Tax=Pedobacter sp. MC2016-15 TaxID=2994473 RepID=UPI0022471965|nr:OsmC family protein [Pedobacter sp. MC2016-15]MCX2478107.1 OsmC family protein [Pedobacter sp. MC2016-15]